MLSSRCFSLQTRNRPELVEGKWDYFVEYDIHEDLLDFDKDNPYFDVQFLAAMALIKARIVCKSKIAKTQYEHFKQYLWTWKIVCCHGRVQLWTESENTVFPVMEKH